MRRAPGLGSIHGKLLRIVLDNLEEIGITDPIGGQPSILAGLNDGVSYNFDNSLVEVDAANGLEEEVLRILNVFYCQGPPII